MKKALLLTSVCALAACGGGSSAPISGGATAGTPTDGRPLTSEHYISADVRGSNQIVTSAASQIFIAKDGSSPIVIRSASPVEINGKQYDEYTLEDIKFYPTGVKPGEEMYVRFLTDDNGRIDTLEQFDNGYELTVTRDGENSIFAQHVYKYKIGDWHSDYFLAEITDPAELRAALEKQLDGKSYKDEILAQIDSGEWEAQNHTEEIEMHGKHVGEGKSKGLRYSDFGYDIMTESDNTEDYSIIAGGYEVMNIPYTEIVGKNMTFRGKAIATGSYKYNNAWKQDHFTTGDNDTVLEMEIDGETITETLTMPFKDYYTVVVTKEGDESQIQFTDWKGAADSKLKFAQENDIVTNDAWIQYFGQNGKPSEAVGTITYEEESTYKPSFDAGFGVKISQ